MMADRREFGTVLFWQGYAFQGQTLQDKWLQDLGFHSGSKIASEEHGGTFSLKQ
ncbi:hypothetical protein SDC9_15058 [bioreactor metagenome]|uniref:Uncharacterized protein n=1 Tax=bioreactor metagenome TaxID=1076179 RepID=A0A644TR30_9ZZZZ|nr:hypothetical protein [Negativicutes bacterium]